uniref:Adenylate kinase n=1 Tax=Steinernema glaseri TaxID=37863 RepID=A0A1I7YSP8_9BILA
MTISVQMGCAPSSRRGSSKGRKGVQIRGRGRDDETDSYIECARTPPKVTVSLGSGVARTPDHIHTVIFIFGGPGSQKGIITQELVQEFEFVSISIEDIVFSFMPNKVANTVENVSEIQELLRRDTGVLTLEWVLSMISAKLSTSMSQRFIIDIVPELQNIMRADSFRSRNHEKHLENFERRHPVLFALELMVSEEKSLLSGKTLRGPESEQINRKELSPELSAFLKGIDEADKGRLEKRIDNYHKCSEPFLDYFRQTRRVIQMDLKVPGNDNVIKTVREALSDFGFSRNSDNIRVVVFVTNERHVGEIDLEYYRLRRFRLSDIAPDRNESFNSQIRSIRRYINRTAEPNENFFVVLDTLNKAEITGMKKINFIEPRETYLEYYIKTRLSREPYARCKMALNAITSTNEEVCLFPRSFSTELARKISYAFSERLSLAESEALTSSESPEPTLSNGSYVPRQIPA